MEVVLPAALSINESFGKNTLRQIVERSLPYEGSLATYAKGRLKGHLFQPGSGDEPVLLIPRTRGLPDGHQRIVGARIERGTEPIDLSEAPWLRHPLLPDSDEDVDFGRAIREVRRSWQNAFHFVEEETPGNVVGLRTPQIGAIHAVHAHWTVSDGPATVVMPTGTGKTDTMISIMVSAGCEKVLVVVPTDALRSQIADHFLRLGILKAPGSRILADSARFPVVCVLRQVPQSAADVDALADRSQVIVTTSHIAALSDSAVQERMAERCSHLIIDEAHHVEAPTWKAFKERFRHRRILQFTATPFREDGKPLDGKVVFHYPLRKAQEQEYFKPIRFEPVLEFNPQRSDAAIAEKAVQRLRADADKGHILMARVDSVARASEVFALYEPHAEFNPVELHTGIHSRRERERARKQIISGESRIVVCVDMLGEGFDLPELKIAAFHDIRKSLAVTLQLAGRFTRVRPGLGEATFIANVADVHVRDEIRKLYTRDPDWNYLLPEYSDEAIGEQLALQEFLAGFTDFADEIPLNTVRPAMSTVVYKTGCSDWSPGSFSAGIPNLSACAQMHHTINAAEHTLVVVAARPVSVEWTEVDVLSSWQWELYVVIWSPEQGLLFINGSTNAGDFRALAKAVAGEDVELIRGNDVFRAFSGVTRLRLQNVGLTEQLGRNIRYTGRMGADVEPGVPDAQRRHTQKTVLAGTGFEAGSAVAVGASRRGRIWSHRRGRVHQLSQWCRNIGDKLLDTGIDPDLVLQGTLKAQVAVGRPGAMPVAVDWPEHIYTSPEAHWYFEIQGEEFSLSQVSLDLVSPSVDSPLRFAVNAGDTQEEVELQLFERNGVSDFRFTCSDSLRIRRGGSEGSSAEAFFDDYPPVFWFSDGSSLEGNQHVELRTPGPPYDRSKIEAWDWAGISIRRESQGKNRKLDTIQAHAIAKLVELDRYQVIVDDDGTGEAADIVAIRVVQEEERPSAIEVDFYHCKFSLDAAPGARIDDLYQVCGQAQKSIHWMTTPEKRTDLFTHLLRREARRIDEGDPSRFEIGDKDALLAIREMSHACPVSLRIFIVQPGLAKSQASSAQLELLSVTETYLMETFQIKLGVIASA